MKKKDDVLIILIILFIHVCSTTLLIVLNKDISELFIIMFYIVSALLFFVVNINYSYVLLITYILGFSLFQVFYIWIYNLPSFTQNKYIAIHFLIVLSTVTLWLSVYLMKKIRIKINNYETKIEENEKFLKLSNILTKSEIKYRLKTLMTSLERNSSNGYIFVVRILDSMEKYKKKVVFDVLAKAWLKTIRSNYDLVGRVNDNTILVVLQKPNNEGLNIVMNRFFETLELDGKIDRELFDIYTLDISKYIEKKKASNISYESYELIDLDFFSGELSKEMVRYGK